jgi:hypothetical protein
MAHGELGEGVTRSLHEKWCDFAYGTAGLDQWLDVGIAPAWHSPRHFGWLSFLTFAFRPGLGSEGPC